MFYGDQESNYTQMRASYGPFGGMMAGGAYSQMAMGGAYYGPGMAPPGSEGAGSMLSQVGGMIRPSRYMAPAQVFVQPSGQYVQQQQSVGQAFGSMIGWNESPRNMSALEYRMNAAMDFGERSGSAAAAGVTTAAGVTVGTMLSPLGAMAGRFVGAGLGGAVGSLLGPIGTGAGAAIGGTIGGFAGSFAAYGAGTAASSMALDLMNQQRNVRNFLENTSFRYATSSTDFADQRLGSGMGTRGRGQVSEMITKMDVKDPFLDSDELTRILQGATSSGLMNNTRSMDEFKRKFKDITENVKVLARTFNTTLEEGLKVMKDFRGIGITESSEVSRLSLRSDALGKVTGRTAREMVEVGMQGAEMYRGTGISMDIGFQASQMNLTSIRAARDAGVLSQEAVAQAGGEEALAQRMTAGSAGFLQSMKGRGTMAGFFSGGKFNTGAFRDFLGGGADLPSFALQSTRNMGTPEQLLSYQAQQPKLLSEMGKQLGGAAPMLSEMSIAMMEAQYLRKQMPGLSSENAFRVALQGMGKSEPEIDTMLATINNAQNEFTAKQKGAAATRDKEVSERAYSNFFFTRSYDKFIKDPITSLKNAVAAPLNRTIDELTEWSKNTWEREGLGLERGDLGGTDTRLVKPPTAADLKSRTVGGLLFSNGQVNLDKGGALAQTAGEMFSAQSDAIAKNFGILAGGSEGEVIVDQRSGVRATAMAAGAIVGGIPGLSMGARVQDKSYSKAQIARVSEISRRIYASDDEISTAQKSEGFKESIRVARNRAAGIDTRGLSGLDIVKGLAGKADEKDLTQTDYIVAQSLYDNESSTEKKALNELGGALLAGKNIRSAVTVEAMQQAKTQYETAKDSATKEIFKDRISAEKDRVKGLGGGALSNLFRKEDPNLSSDDFNKLIAAKSEKDEDKKRDLINEVAAGVANRSGKSIKEEAKYLSEGLGRIDTKSLEAASQNAALILQQKYLTATKESLLAGAESYKGDDKEAVVSAAESVSKVLDTGDVREFVSTAKAQKDFLNKAGQSAMVRQAEGLDSVGKAMSSFKEDLASKDENVRKGALGKLQAGFQKSGLGLSEGDFAEWAKTAQSKIASGDAGAIDSVMSSMQQDLREKEAGKTDVSAGDGRLQAGGSDPQAAFQTQININAQILSILSTLAGRLK